MPTLTSTTVGAFCRELVCGLEPLPDLLNDWEITEEQFEALRKNEAFQKELKTAVADIREMGPDSAFIVRCKQLSETFLGTIVGMMDDRMTPPEVKANLFKTITELARLHAPKTQSGGPSINAPLVTFSFGEGMPGISKIIAVEPVPVAQVEQQPADG